MNTHRPRQFKDIAGQGLIKKMIQESLTENTFPQLTYFEGPSGTGKSTIAEITALSLTCPNANPEPCLECDNCKEALTGFRSNAPSSHIVKVNVGKVVNKNDVTDIIKEIFVLQPKTGVNTVYILEEVHALPENQQIPFLEEMSNMPEGVYVMMCTTHPHRLIPQLRGRATRLTVKQPSTEECEILIDDVCRHYGIRTLPSKAIKRTIIQRVGHEPRAIVKTISFVSLGKSYLDEEVVKEYLGVISFKDYLNLFQSMSNGLYAYTRYLGSLTDKGVTKVDIAQGLKDFFMDVQAYLYGNFNLPLDTHSKGLITKVFGSLTDAEFIALAEEIGAISVYTEDYAHYALIGLMKYMMKRDPKVVIEESSKEAVKTGITSQRNSNVIERKAANDVATKSQKLDLTSAIALTGNRKVVDKDDL